MKSCFFAVLMLLSFAANAGVITKLGFNFDTSAKQVFSGQTVFWNNNGPDTPFAWEEGALNFNNYPAAAGGAPIFAFESTVPNLYPENIKILLSGFTTVDNGVYTPNPNPSTLSFTSIANNSSGDIIGLLLEGSLSGSSFTVTGGELAPWFDTGVFLWSREFDPNNEDVNQFTLTMTASPVPVPAAAWLFMSGLIALVTVTHRRRI